MLRLYIECLRQKRNHNTVVKNKEDRFFADNQLVVLRKVHFKKAMPVPSNLISLDLQQVGFTSLNFLVQVLEKCGQPGLRYERCGMPKRSGVCPNFMQIGDKGGLQSDNGTMINPEDFKQFTYVNGHIPWWPDLADLTNAQGITAVRYPAGINGRAIADANFAYMRGYVKNKHEAEEYIRAFVDNLQTRMIAGVDYMDGDCTEETLQQAKDNIEKRFLLVWTTDEDMNKFVEILSSIMGWGNIALPKQTQVSGDKIFAYESDISPELEDYIKNANRFDIELYNFVKARMKVWLAEHVDGYEDIGPEEMVRCYLADYAQNRIPYEVTRMEIDLLNQTVPQGLIETEQDWPDNYDDIKLSRKFKM